MHKKWSYFCSSIFRRLPAACCGVGGQKAELMWSALPFLHVVVGGCKRIMPRLGDWLNLHSTDFNFGDAGVRAFCAVGEYVCCSFSEVERDEYSAVHGFF